jgi:hypothetical protein
MADAWLYQYIVCKGAGLPRYFPAGEINMEWFYPAMI